jgi:transcriptional antiterminator
MSKNVNSKEKKIEICLKSIENANKIMKSVEKQRRKVSDAYDFVFELIQKSEKKSPGHLHLLVIEDSINTTSKELVDKFTRSRATIENRTEQLHELRNESDHPKVAIVNPELTVDKA